MILLRPLAIALVALPLVACGGSAAKPSQPSAPTGSDQGSAYEVIESPEVPAQHVTSPFVPGAASADATAKTGVISGHMAGPAGGASGVAIAATSDALQGNQTIFTDDSGDYLLKELPPGHYKLELYVGALHVFIDDVTVATGKATIVDHAFTAEELSAEETVEIRATP